MTGSAAAEAGAGRGSPDLPLAMNSLPDSVSGELDPAPGEFKAPDPVKPPPQAVSENIKIVMKKRFDKARSLPGLIGQFPFGGCHL